MRGFGRALVFTVLGLFLAPPASALPFSSGPFDPSPQAPNAIDAAYQVRVRSTLDGFQIAITLAVFEAEGANGIGAPAAAIREGNAPAHAIFEEAIRARVQQELGQAFAGAETQLEALRFDYGVSDLDADPFRPPIRVEGSARVHLTPAFIGLPGRSQALAADAARALLYSGGTFRMEQSLVVPAGFKVQLGLVVPPTLRLQDPTHSNASRLDFQLDNLRGPSASRLAVRFAIGLQASQVPENVRAGPVIRAQFMAFDDTPLWMQVAPFTTGRFSADLDLRVDLHSLPTSVFARESPFPPQISLANVSADLLRVAVRAGLLSPDDLHAFFERLISRSLRTDYGEGLDVTMDRTAFDRSLHETIGGRDGQTVAPLVIRAGAHLPLKSDRMLFSSVIGRSAGMFVPLSSSFPLVNDGPWDLELTIYYPSGVDVQALDRLDRVQNLALGDRDGFRIFLAKGESTQIRVKGKAPFDASTLGLALLEMSVLAGLAVWSVREYRQARIRGLPAWLERLIGRSEPPSIDM